MFCASGAEKPELRKEPAFKREKCGFLIHKWKIGPGTRPVKPEARRKAGAAKPRNARHFMKVLIFSAILSGLVPGGKKVRKPPSGPIR